MTQEEKDLLLRDLCGRLPYGVKILYTGWDCDSGTDFDTVETLIGIDDRFIYTIWDKTGNREKHCLSVSNWKPYLRPMSSMTEEEKEELIKNFWGSHTTKDTFEELSWHLSKHLDINELIPKGLAIEAPEGMYNLNGNK